MARLDFEYRPKTSYHLHTMNMMGNRNIAPFDIAFLDSHRARERHPHLLKIFYMIVPCETKINLSTSCGISQDAIASQSKTHRIEQAASLYIVYDWLPFCGSSFLVWLVDWFVHVLLERFHIQNHGSIFFSQSHVFILLPAGAFLAHTKGIVDPVIHR